MNKGITAFLLVLVTLALGMFIGSRWTPAPDPAEQSDSSAQPEREILYWVAPMDPNFRRDGPGKSPMGMDLVPVYAGGNDPTGEVIISPSVEQNLGVRSQPATVRPLWRRIEATGYVGFDETRISHINLRTQGWIVRLAVNAEGERVAQGDLLFELYSPELVNAQKEYLQAYQRGDARLQKGADEKLRVLGMIRQEIDALARTRQVSENIKVIAPQDGIVASLSVREGMYVQPNTAIMSLADLSSVWLLAEVFESQAEWVAVGQAAEARLDYMPGTVFSGQVDYVYPVLDPATRTLRVRLRFENPQERLKPNMYARVSLFGRLRPSALTIPREALIRGPERDRVVVALGQGRFRVHEVLTGMESGAWVEIIAGIQEGDEIVTSAQFLLDSEASLAGTVHRLDEFHEARDTTVPVRAFGSGWIEAVDLSAGKVRVSHGPIDQLGWPSMTMDFQVDESVDLGSLQAGQDVQFVLRQQHAGEFAIEKLSLRHAGVDLAPGQQAADEFPAVTGPVQMPRYNGQATIVEVEAQDGVLKLDHEPIAALGWPSMVMNFDVAPEVDLSDLVPGMAIHFSMVKQEDGYVIVQVHAVPQDNPGGRHDD